MVIDLGEPMTVLGVQIQRRSGYDILNGNEYVSMVRVSSSMVEPAFPPVNLGLGAYGNTLKPRPTLTSQNKESEQGAAQTLAARKTAPPYTNDLTTLLAAPYQKGGSETTLFWIGYDIDAVGWADVRFRDSVLAQYVKIFLVECQNRCSMRARVRVLSRAGCFLDNFYTVSGAAYRKLVKKGWGPYGRSYKVRDFAKNYLMGTNPLTQKPWPLRNATSAVACQQRCLNAVGCEYFTYFRGKAGFAVGENGNLGNMTAENLCYLQNRDAVVLPLSGRHWSPQMDAIEPLLPLLGQGRSRTGTKHCHSGGPGLRVQSTNLARRRIVFTPTQCQELCQGIEECEYFSFWADGGCSLYRKHAKKVLNTLTGVPVWSASKKCLESGSIPPSHKKALCDLATSAGTGAPLAGTAGGIDLSASTVASASATSAAFLENAKRKTNSRSLSQDRKDFLKVEKRNKVKGDFAFCFHTGMRYTGGRQTNSFGSMDDGVGYVLGTSVVNRLYTYDAVLATGANSAVGWLGGTVTSGGRVCREGLTKLQQGEGDPFTKKREVKTMPKKCPSGGTEAQAGEAEAQAVSRFIQEDFLLAAWEIKVVCDKKISSYRLPHKGFFDEKESDCKPDKERRLLKCKELCLLTDDCELLWHDEPVRHCHGYRKCDGVLEAGPESSATTQAGSTETEQEQEHDASAAVPTSAGAGVLWALLDSFDAEKLPKIPEECEQEQPPEVEEDEGDAAAVKEVLEQMLQSTTTTEAPGEKGEKEEHDSSCAFHMPDDGPPREQQEVVV
eukprot:g6169.t1